MVWTPALKLNLGFVQNLSSFVGVCKGLSDVTGHNWSIVKKVEESATVSGKNNLLLGSFDGSGKVEVVGLLDLLSGLAFVSSAFVYGEGAIQCW